MTRDPVLDLAERQHGAISLGQLRGLDLSRHATWRAARSTDWERATDEVMVRRGAPRSIELELMVAALDSGPDSVLSHHTAAHRWGLTGCRLRPIQVIRESRSSRRSTLTDLHTVRCVPDSWVTHLDLLPIVRPELVAMQLFAGNRPATAERWVDRLWSFRLLSGPSILRFLDEHGARGRNGIAALREYVAERGAGYIPPTSGIEARFMQLVSEECIAMRRQVDSGGIEWTGRVDFRHDSLPLIVEIQSERYHTALCDRVADEQRRAQLLADGFTIVEITDTLLFSDPGEVIAQLRAAIATLRNA